VLPATFGGDLTVTAEVFSAGLTGNHWSRIVDLGNGPTEDNILLGFPGGEAAALEYQVRFHKKSSAIFPFTLRLISA